MRPACFGDTRRLVDMLVEQQTKSVYAGLVGVNTDVARKLIAGLIGRHGNSYDGGSLCNVVEVDGVIEAFSIGVLQRVYLIGDRLEAVDVFLIATGKAPATAWRALRDAYLAWADQNHRVVQTILSHSDALPTGARMSRSYAKLGFAKSGEMWVRRKLPYVSLKEAA